MAYQIEIEKPNSSNILGIENTITMVEVSFRTQKY